MSDVLNVLKAEHARLNAELTGLTKQADAVRGMIAAICNVAELLAPKVTAVRNRSVTADMMSHAARLIQAGPTTAAIVSKATGISTANLLYHCRVGNLPRITPSLPAAAKTTRAQNLVKARAALVVSRAKRAAERSNGHATP